MELQLMESLKEIPGWRSFERIEKLTKGWSADEKYIIGTTAGETLLVRLAAAASHDKKRREFALMKQLSDFGIPMAQPLDFGWCAEGTKVYTLLRWVEGEDAQHRIPALSPVRQYQLGIRSGQILKRIHGVPAPADALDWALRFNRKTDRKIEVYETCRIKIPGDQAILDYLRENRSLLENRPQCFHHGDYHVGNMVLSNRDRLFIIDFDRCDHGDPWEEFNRIVWSAQLSPWFATGQLRGYFEGDPPMAFFRLLAFYIASNTLSSVPWAISFGMDEVNTMLDQAGSVLEWFDDFRNPVPTWFLPENKCR